MLSCFSSCAEYWREHHYYLFNVFIAYDYNLCNLIFDVISTAEGSKMCLKTGSICNQNFPAGNGRLS